MKTQLQLQDSFQKQKQNMSYRSSAVFPLRIQNGTDLEIAFLNYWKLKNHIDKVLVNFRFYDTEGSLILFKSIPEIVVHNSFSMSKMSALESFDGMVEVEILALENLVFSFPALVGFYRSKNLVSVVHSAGRIKNAEERCQAATTEETNWSCKLSKDIEPFFHLFNGRLSQPQQATLCIYDLQNKLFKECVFSLPSKPFASKIYLLSELVNLEDLPSEFFIGLRLTAHDIFPRLIVGNFHQNEGFFEATHSFPKTEIVDYIVPPPKYDGTNFLLSTLATICPPDLELCLRVFPTNNPAQIEYNRYETQKSGHPLKKISCGHLITGGAESKIWEFKQIDSEGMNLFEFLGDQIPSRINTSFVYKVKGSKSAFSTDFALGAHSWVYPAKKHHWGHGLQGAGFKTVLLIGNFRHEVEMNRDVSASVQIFSKHQNDNLHVEIKKQSYSIVYLNQFHTSVELQTFSWYLTADSTGLFCYWIAYNTATGAICAEHSF